MYSVMLFVIYSLMCVVVYDVFSDVFVVACNVFCYVCCHLCVDASKVELLKVENRRLHNQLHTPCTGRLETTGDDSTDSSTSACPDTLEPSWVKTYIPLADSVHLEADEVHGSSAWSLGTAQLSHIQHC